MRYLTARSGPLGPHHTNSRECGLRYPHAQNRRRNGMDDQMQTVRNATGRARVTRATDTGSTRTPTPAPGTARNASAAPAPVTARDCHGSGTRNSTTADTTTEEVSHAMSTSTVDERSAGDSPRAGSGGWSAGWSGSAGPGPAAPTGTPRWWPPRWRGGPGWPRGCGWRRPRSGRGSRPWRSAPESTPPAGGRPGGRTARPWPASPSSGRPSKRSATPSPKRSGRRRTPSPATGASATSGTGTSPGSTRSAPPCGAASPPCAIVSAQAKRFEPQLIEKDWRR